MEHPKIFPLKILYMKYFRTKFFQLTVLNIMCSKASNKLHA